MKIIHAVIWTTTNGAHPREMQEVRGCLDDVVRKIKHYNPTLPLENARDMIRRATFQMDPAWHVDRSVGVQVCSVITTVPASDAFAFDQNFVMDYAVPTPRGELALH